MRSSCNIWFLAIGLMFLSGCSGIKHVPAGEHLLRRNKVDLVRAEKEQRTWREHRTMKTNLTHLQRQESNNRFVFMPLRLWMYSSVSGEKNNWWTRFMQNAGEAPVVFDSLYADLTIRQMQQFLINNGHFNSDVFYTSRELKRKQRVALTYHINTGRGYRYRNIALDVRDSGLMDAFHDWQEQTLVKSGDPHNANILEAERTRVQRQLQNLGYYLFNRNHIEFLMDSALNSYEMDVTMIINPPREGGYHQKFTFADVHIFPDERAARAQQVVFDTTIYQLPRSRTDSTPVNYYFIHSQPLRIRPGAIASKILIQPESAYSLTNVERTYENLLDLRMFRSTNVSIQPQSTSVNDPQFLLNTTIELQQVPKWVIEADFDITNSDDGLQGISAYTALRNRNTFGGAEILSLRLRGLTEVRHFLNPNVRQDQGYPFVDNYDIGISANLDIPRFILPFDLWQRALHRPRTLINMGYSYRSRSRFYNRHLTNLSFGYTWRQPQVSHTLFPLDISLVNISLVGAFRDTIESIDNNRLRNQYASHFLFSTRYGFSYSGQQGNRPIDFNMFRFSIETSGNALNVLSRALDAPKDEEDRYRFFNLVYAQYIRVEGDFRRYWHLTDRQILVTRLMGGAGFAYGNSRDLPYEKGFFAGGNNNIRAWPMNMLGPGSFNNPDKLLIERVGDIVLIGNIEYRFPISGAFKGALFVDAGNIWRNDNLIFPNGEFLWKNVPNDLAIGGGFGLRWDLMNLFVIRLDAAVPLRNPEKPNGEKWIMNELKLRDFVLNFGIGYPF